MAKKTPRRLQVLVTAYLLMVTGAAAQKVYFDCGAVVDVVDTQGLILSPGFPYNYTPGTHCVWQFFVPLGYQLVMEMFDFDVFESPNQGRVAEYDLYDATTPVRGDSPSNDLTTNEGPLQKDLRGPQKGKVKPTVVQEQYTKMEEARVSSWPSFLPQPPSAQPVASGGDGDIDRGPTPATLPLGKVLELSMGTQGPPVDTCPHDVLYISDLISFSSRFCGPNNPTGRPMVFGSLEEMVEVIVELITTTHWGRGFALLFRYRNHSDVGDRHLLMPPAGQKETLLAAMGGLALFILVLTGILCIIFRPKLCTKGIDAFSSGNSEAGVQEGRADGGEMQLVGPRQLGEEPSMDGAHVDRSRPSSLTHTGSGSVIGRPDISHNAELELSPDGLTGLDLGTDEVFVIASGLPPSGSLFCPPTQRDRSLRHSDSALPAQPDSLGRIRPRAWSVRTFQDLLPRMHRDWCSWNSGKPFTKLVDTTPASSAPAHHSRHARKVFSDGHLEGETSCGHAPSIGSTSSYPLTQSTQRQRRLNSTSNLRRSIFTAPCFGLLPGPLEGGSYTPRTGLQEQAAGPTCRELQPEPQAGAAVPEFVISEEEDRQPLVQAEHLNGQHHEPTGLTDEATQAEWTGFPCGDSSRLAPGSPPANRKTKLNFIHNATRQLQPLSLSPSAVGKEM